MGERTGGRESRQSRAGKCVLYFSGRGLSLMSGSTTTSWKRRRNLVMRAMILEDGRGNKALWENVKAVKDNTNSMDRCDFNVSAVLIEGLKIANSL